MAKLTSASSLNRDIVQIDVALRNIDLTKTGVFSDDGVSLQALYSYLKSVWRTTDFTSAVASSAGAVVTFDNADIDVDVTGLVSGTKYQIKTPGDANWTAIGAANSDAGTVFIYNGVTITGTTGVASTRGNSLNILPGMKVSISAGAGALTDNIATVVSVAADGSTMTLDKTASPVMNDTTELLVVNHLIEYPFPLVAITPEQFEFQFDWTMTDETAKKLLRDAGWQELATGAVDGKKYTGIISLGTIDTVTGVSVTGSPASGQAVLPVDDASALTVGMEVRVLSGTGVLPANTKIQSISSNNVTLNQNISTTFDNSETLLFGDRVYYAFYDTNTTSWTTPVDFDFLGPVNEAIVVDDGVNPAGDFSNQVLALFIRTEAKTYGKASTPDIGIPDQGGVGAGNINFQVYRFPLSEGTDLNYTATASDILIEGADAAGEKFDATTVSTTAVAGAAGTNLEVASGIGASIAVGSSVFDSASFIPAGTYVTAIVGDDLTLSKASTSGFAGGETVEFVNGPHIVFHGADQSSADYFNPDLSGGPYQYGVTINARDGSSGATLGSLTLGEVYTWVQYKLRQVATIDADLDIDAIGVNGPQSGKVSDTMLTFVGADVQSVNLLTPLSAAWGVGNLDRATVTDGTGVLLFQFASGSIGNVKLRDNTGVLRFFPTISSGFITFGGETGNMLTDIGSSFTMFFTYTRSIAVSAMTWARTGGAGTFAGTLSTSTTWGVAIDTGAYLKLTGFTDPNLNAVVEVTTGAAAGGNSISVTYIDDLEVASEGPVAGTFQFNPVDSPDAVIVKDAGDVEIQGTLANATGNAGAYTAVPTLDANDRYVWNFAYTTNTQPGTASNDDSRVGDADVPITIRAVGQNKAQWTSVNGTINEGSGITFQVLAPLERNYVA